MDPIEEYEARRSLRRSRGRWRIAAILALLGAIGVFFALNPFEPEKPHIARYELTDVIFDDRARDTELREIAEDPMVRAMILHISSPGGTVVGSEALFESIRDVAAEKPVVATIGEVAASGGYIAALAADHIVARGNSITGSVGVIFQMPNAHALLERVGVEMVEIKSGDMKAEPTPYSPVSEQVIAAQRLLIEDSFDWFTGLVEERRALSGNAAATIRDGRVFTGRMALDLGLIDAIGDEDEVREWLEAEHGIDPDLDVEVYGLPEEEFDPLSIVGARALIPQALRGVIETRMSTGLWAIYR